MLEVLFGNKTVSQILLYLQKHERSYATEIARKLKVPLNMVQKQLERLARGQILTRYFEGKNKVYEWNQSYQLHEQVRKFLATCRDKAKKGIKKGSENPADGSHLSLRERIKLADRLTKQAEKLNPYPRPKAFVKTFDNFKDYEKWKKKQTNPWLT